MLALPCCAGLRLALCLPLLASALARLLSLLAGGGRSDGRQAVDAAGPVDDVTGGSIGDAAPHLDRLLRVVDVHPDVGVAV